MRLTHKGKDVFYRVGLQRSCAARRSQSPVACHGKRKRLVDGEAAHGKRSGKRGAAPMSASFGERRKKEGKNEYLESSFYSLALYIYINA